jgi:DNA-directed RNA polymerase specialized sigma24 family protein
MTARQYLSEARNIKFRLAAMSEQREFLKAAAAHVTTQFSDMPKSATPNFRKSEDAIIRIADFEERITAQYDKLAEISDTVDKLQDPLHRTVLVKHYFSGKTWREVAAETYYSERTVRNVHSDALAEVEKLIELLP